MFDPGDVRVGRARGRYFRENFAQGGVDLVQIIPELVTNADAAISAAGRSSGQIVVSLAPPDPELLALWAQRMAQLGSPALMSWRWELACTDDGEGVDAELVDARLGALGVSSPRSGQRGLFGRGLRDVWLAQGAGRIEGVRAGQMVASWFFPAAGDDPYAFVHVRQGDASAADLQALGVAVSGTRVTVPLAATRLPTPGRLRGLLSGLVQLRPVLEDPGRALTLALEGQAPEPITYTAPEPDPERPVLFEDWVTVADGIRAHVVIRRAAEPLPAGFSRATRRGGLVIRSGRAAHESTLAGQEGRPGARHLYGEVICEALEDLQRAALDSPRPELVVKVDRSGLNEHHPIVQALYRAIDGVLAPIVAAEERRVAGRVIGAPRAVSARDQVGLRALNDLLKGAFDQPGRAGKEPGEDPAAQPAAVAVENLAGEEDGDGEDETAVSGPVDEDRERGLDPEPAPLRGLWFKRSPLRMYPGEQRSVTLLIDPYLIDPGSTIDVEVDASLALSLRSETVPEPGSKGLCTLAGTLRAKVSAEPGANLSVLAACGEHTAELEVIVVRHRSAGWVREIARQNEDQPIEAEFDPESGVVTVYEGRREFRELERAAKAAGLPRRRAPEYVPYRMLEVEAAANAVYAWAAERILATRLPEEKPVDPAEYAAAVRHQHQALRHLAHHKLMRAFLEPEIFDGQVSVETPEDRSQLRLM
jgi:hypothetical protein